MTERKLDEAEEGMILEIMDYFNFEKVRRVMEFLDWSWATTEHRVPTEPELRAEARHLLERVLLEKLDYTACGGFFASFYHRNLRLEFYINEWSTSRTEWEADQLKESQ